MVFLSFCRCFFFKNLFCFSLSVADVFFVHIVSSFFFFVFLTVFPLLSSFMFTAS
jgi:hypothetical protein